MPTSINPATYEDVWSEVYSNAHKEYKWLFATKKEAERWRFRALGYINAVRKHVEEWPEDRVRYGVQLSNMNRRVHHVRQAVTGWEMVVAVRPAGPAPVVSDVVLEELDRTSLTRALSSKETEEEQAEYEKRKERGEVQREKTDREKADDALAAALGAFGVKMIKPEESK